MTDSKKKPKQKNKREYEKPVSLSPLAFQEAVAGLLGTPPMPKEEKPTKKKPRK